MVCHEPVPTIVGDMELTTKGQSAMQSYVFGVHQQIVGEIKTKLSPPRFRPRLACHEAHDIDGAIAVAHGVYTQGADRLSLIHI